MTWFAVTGCASTETTGAVASTPAREPTWISGEIMGVDRVPIEQYNDSTVRLVVTTEAREPVRLDLGPGWYVEQQGLSFRPEQHIEYRGDQNAQGAVTVYEIRQGASQVKLRDSTGQPQWQTQTRPQPGD